MDDVGQCWVAILVVMDGRENMDEVGVCLYNDKDVFEISFKH